MSTYKRRIVYLSDGDWNGLRVAAAQEKTTISAVIRRLITPPAATPLAGTAQERRDALLGKINRGKS